MALLVFSCSKKEQPMAPQPASRDLNVPPVAAIAVTGECSGFPTTLDASPGSYDPDGKITRYEWDLNNDGVIDTSGATLTRVVHQYASGNHRAKLVVTDDHGAYTVTVASFEVGIADTTYVSADTGSPAGTGSAASPLSTISAALATTPSGPCPHFVMVAYGYYPESVTFPSNLVLRGGLNPHGWAKLPGKRSQVWVGSGHSTSINNIHSTTISGVEFLADSAYGYRGFPVAVWVASCDSSLLFVDCRFASGNASPGVPGVGGSYGPSGQPGQDASGGTGGAGGKLVADHIHSHAEGGNGANGNNVGLAGQTYYCGAGGAGGLFGICGSRSVENGMAGTDGVPGTGGAGPIRSDGSWNPGTPGCWGGGGGGGGGGPTCPTSLGGGGGGGGQGGGPGQGATGGFSGSNSIAVSLYAASPTFDHCIFVSGAGGRGGQGGAGGRGGDGGSGGRGGNPLSESVGGMGGAGGAGGDGGGGQGGAGGSTWCLYLYAGSNPNLIAPTFAPGPAGAGGAGGLDGHGRPSGAAGANGVSANIGP